MLTAEQAGRYLGLSVWAIRDLVAAGTLPRVMLPLGPRRELRRFLVDRADLDRLVEQSKR